MKQILLLVPLSILLCFSACSNNNIATDVATECVPADYGSAIELAEAEFDVIFTAFDGLVIQDISTMTRTDDNRNVLVQITYTSNNGDGIYGFEFLKDEYGNYGILQQGEAVTIDNLIR